MDNDGRMEDDFFLGSMEKLWKINYMFTYIYMYVYWLMVPKYP